MSLHMSRSERIIKLRFLVEVDGSEGIPELLEKYSSQDDAIGICRTEGCDYITIVGRTEKSGRCIACGTDTVVSCLLLAGVA